MSGDELIAHIGSRFFTRGVAVLHDLLMIPLAWMTSYWLRFNLGEIPAHFLGAALWYLAIIIPVQAGTFWFFGLYRGVWRFASIPDIVRILKSSGVGLMISLLVLFALFRLEDIPRSVPIIYFVLLILFLSGPRFIYRWIKDRRVVLIGGRRVLIVGAGRAGEMLARDMLRERSSSFSPVAFVDDKPRRIGRDLHGVPVVGSCDSIPETVQKLAIDVAVLAIPSASTSQQRRLVGLCESAGVPFRTVPPLRNLMSGQVAINQLREVSIEDLLGRDTVALDWPAIRDALTGKTVLVTGGGGSIGSELCRQLTRLEPERMIILDNSEFNLYAIEMDLQNRFPGLKLECCLVDVADRPCVENIFDRHRPDVVFHAAAYKHVPMLESQIRQAMRNNVLGTRNVAEAADRYRAGVLVLVSTDKAVNPGNVMGASKRAAEVFCQNLDIHSETHFITVRFGNVLGSTGSVIPLFRKQIEEGGPITVTDPRMERYFMTISEACQLIMQTVVLGDGGEIFVLDMGEPVKISYLAEQMIRLSGKVPGEEIEIKYIGLRPGEKLYEELFHEKEELEATAHPKVFLARHRKVEWEWLNRMMEDIAFSCEAMDAKSLKAQLSALVPEHDRQVTKEISEKAKDGVS